MKTELSLTTMIWKKTVRSSTKMAVSERNAPIKKSPLGESNALLGNTGVIGYSALIQSNVPNDQLNGTSALNENKRIVEHCSQ